MISNLGNAGGRGLWLYVLRNGRVSFTSPAAELHNDAKLREVYL